MKEIKPPNKFKPSWWLKNCHLQTIFPTLYPRRIKLDTERERIALPDNDFVDLDWIVGGNHNDIVLILHGIAGSIASPYVQGMLNAITTNGWKGVLLNFRGCSGEANRLPRSFHSGETEDLSFIIQLLKTRFKNSRIAVIGYSLGGNVLLKWLGETIRANQIDCAVAISVPFDLFNAVDCLQKGFSRFYQWRLLQELKKNLIKKSAKVQLHVEPHTIKNLKTFTEFDETITAPLHGFESAEHYYSTSSSKQYLKGITIPTLIIQSKDDPFISYDAIPTTVELSESILLEVTDSGGHVGFISGSNPMKPKFWLEERIVNYLHSFLTN